MDRCVVNQDGEVRLHRHRKAAPAPFLQAMAPDREARVVGVEGLFPWYGLADRCARDGLPCVRGHARALKALPGGQATHDTIDAQNIAVLRRGGRRPPADV